MPLFNGNSENDLKNFEKYLDNVKVSKKDKKIVGSIFIAKTKNQVIYFDVGGPPSKNSLKIINPDHFRLNIILTVM